MRRRQDLHRKTRGCEVEGTDGAEVCCGSRTCSSLQSRAWGFPVCVACPGHNGGGLNGAEREGRPHPPFLRALPSIVSSSNPHFFSAVAAVAALLGMRAHAIPTFRLSPSGESKIGNAKRGELAWTLLAQIKILPAALPTALGEAD